MALTLSCFILDQGEDALTHWFEIELRAGEVILDGDIFRYVKATKRVLLNPQFDLDGNQISPDIQIPAAIWEDREGNSFDYDTVMDTAARHFLRRQGMLTKLEQWSPDIITRKSGTVVSKTDGRTLAARRVLMSGATVDISTPTKSGTLQKLDLHRGTVSTISADYDAEVNANGTKTTDLTVLNISTSGISSLIRRRTVARFPLAAIGASDIISNVDIKINVLTTPTATSEGRIQAYNIDGQADPNVDIGSDVYSRIKDDGTPYLSGHTFPDSTGIKTLTIAADADVEAAVDTPDRFSLGMSWTSPENASTDGFDMESSENAGTDEPKLVVTHAAPVNPTYDQSAFRFRNDDGPLGELA